MIKCGKCKESHASVVEVRSCYGAAAIAAKPLADAASDKQMAFIARLREERGLDALRFSGTKKQASAEIDRLMSLPKPVPAATAPSLLSVADIPEGMHKVGDEIYKVQRAVHGSGHLYAKRLVPGEGYGTKATFVYAPGILRALSEGTRMTLEEAKAFGALYGTCCVCGRTLTNEASIDDGIGPVCASKGNWS